MMPETKIEALSDLSFSELEDVIADSDYKLYVGPETDDTVTIPKPEFDLLKALELDREKIACGLSKIEKTNAGTTNQMMQGIALIKEGIGRKVKDND